jgi:hypothetical protein
MDTHQDTKSTLAIWIGLAIPVAMIFFVAIAIYVPRMFSNVPPPQYGFVYTLEDYPVDYYYRVEGGRLLREDVPRVEGEPRPISNKVVASDQTLYYYNVTTKSSQAITLEEAQQFTLDPAGVAPDGYEISSANGGSFLFFDARSRRVHYLMKDGYYEEVDLRLAESDFWRFAFVGWVIDEQVNNEKTATTTGAQE